MVVKKSQGSRGPLLIVIIAALLIVGTMAVWLFRSSFAGNRRATTAQPGAETVDNSAKPNPGAIVRNQVGMEFAYVPAGEFMMGSENRSDDEKPVRRVIFREGFYMGRYEVTQAQWAAVMGSNPSKFKDCDQCPVEQVSWDDAQEFMRRLNERGDGYTYRLPSEAEWEYACRAGTTADYAGSVDAMGWYYENSGDARLTDSEWSSDRLRSNNNHPHRVGEKQPNAWGLYDMHGNVWEWCEDWYQRNYNGAPSDGSAWVSGGEQKYRVLRGGSWVNRADFLRSAYRYDYSPVYRIPVAGLRVVALARR